MEILGQTPREIAVEIGLQPDTIRELIRLPQYSTVRERALDRVYAPVDAEIRRRVGETLERLAPDAAQVLADLIHSPDEVTARIAATAVLDRVGHGPIRRRAVRQRHELDAVTVALLTEALRESNMAKQLMTPELVEGDSGGAS